MKLFLNGGGCGSQTIDTYTEINKIIDHSKPVLYIPLAMDEKDHPYDDCYEWIKGEIVSIDIPNIEMVRDFKELSEKDFSNYSMLYIGGGNTFKLLKGIKEYNSFNKILDFLNSDGIVYGSSAGSIIFCKDIKIIEPMDPNNINLKETKGFNVLNNIYLFVHYKNYRSKLTKEENEKTHKRYTDFLTEYSIKGEKIIAFPEENTLFWDGKNFKMIGKSPYYIFKNGEISEMNQNNIIEL